MFNHDASLIVAGMGFGKTVCTLTAIVELMDADAIGRVLILAPLQVCNTVWRQEARKWGHTLDLDIRVATGVLKEREAAIKSDADVVLLNYENLIWFCKKYKKNDHGFTGLVCDELSMLKNSSSTGFKRLKPRLKAFTWRVGLTGTPVSEDFDGLFSQTFVLDSGKRLGTNKKKFLVKYFTNPDYQGFNWELKDPEGVELLDAIKDLVFIADDDAYKKSLPPIHHHIVNVTMPESAKKAYITLKRSCVLDDITAVNAAVLMGKLQQAASGFVYGEDDEGGFVIDTHFEKLAACKKIVADTPTPVIIAYWFEEDFNRLCKQFPHAVSLKGKNSHDIMSRWNNGEIDVLLLHPRSAGHGVELQFGGSTVVWYVPIWSRDITEQTEARVWRRRQTEPVHVYTLCTKGTVEKLIMRRVGGKASFEEVLMAHLG